MNLTEEEEQYQLYELEVLKEIGFKKLSTKNVDKDNYSLIKVIK